MRPKKENPKMQRSIMLDPIVYKAIEAEAKETERTFSATLNMRLRKSFKFKKNE